VTERVPNFLRAVHEEGEQAPGGWVRAATVMGRMGLRASSLPDQAHNPTTDDDRLYTRLARNCKDRGLIEGNDRYVWVKITDAGKRYLGV
jgi:hypothetical protein